MNSVLLGSEELCVAIVVGRAIGGLYEGNQRPGRCNNLCDAD